MEVHVTSKEILKPSSATPSHLRTYKFSLLDQSAPPIYNPIILFYTSMDESFCKKSDHLKKSFSETLTHFYPFAGRIRDEFSIDCNDDGAAFVEACVAGDMSTVVQQTDINQLQQLLPCSPYDKSPELSTQVMLAVQLNYFGCGGLAIGICIWHAVADASALATFAASWAAITRGVSNSIDGLIFDSASLFPPQDLSSFSLCDFVKEDVVSKIVMKRFLFNSSKVAALREEVGNGSYLDHPTRFEALSALILETMMAVTSETAATQINAATIAVNLRKRMEPPIPQQSIGNIYQVTIANWPNNENNMVNHYDLAGKIHESIRKMNNEYIRKLHAGGGYLDFLKKAGKEVRKGPNLTVFGFSSWCRFPFYDTDFGWGKPIWVSPAFKLNRVAIFLDARDGKGIEAWLGLSKEDMVKFEQDPRISSYASFSPTI